MKRQPYRQGDVLVIPIDGRSRRGVQLKAVPRDRGRIVLAYGEVTGHAHAILDRDAELYEGVRKDQVLEDRFLAVLAEGGVALVHEEHGTITLPKGDYVIRRQREYSPEAIRRVAD